MKQPVVVQIIASPDKQVLVLTSCQHCSAVISKLEVVLIGGKILLMFCIQKLSVFIM